MHERNNDHGERRKNSCPRNATFKREEKREGMREHPENGQNETSLGRKRAQIEEEGKERKSLNEKRTARIPFQNEKNIPTAVSSSAKGLLVPRRRTSFGDCAESSLQ